MTLRWLILAGATASLLAQGPTNPDAACAGCHAAIFRGYEQTPMARGSGLAVEGKLEGGFRHTSSGVDYRVFLRADALWLTFDRASPPLDGERKLLYFIGSGWRGRTYLYQQAGQWFEAPINFYTGKAVWDMAPNFGGSRSMPSPLPVDANCLHCHATSIAAPLPEARNRFAAAPFAQGGIGCSACHGDPAAHRAARGHAPIVNPGKLTSSRRDSTCLQCHLEGDAAVFRAGTSPAGFRPGDDLDAYAVYFVKASAQSGGGRAASQYEALLRSACKAGAGDKLTCTTCHDPHSTPAPAERVAFFRSRCLTCHTSPTMAQHHPEQPDCAACHMPTRDTTDISHNQSTDHNIQRNPVLANLRFATLAETTELVPVGKARVTDRDLGLAYAQLAARGDRASGQKALSLLAKVPAEGDTPVHVQLGFLHQRAGELLLATNEYKAALKLEPYEPTALGNLAVLDAASGHAAEAVQLLQRLLAADPSQTAAGLNLAFIQCRLGNKEDARATLKTVAAYAPDDPTLRKLLDTGAYGDQRCALR